MRWKTAISKIANDREILRGYNLSDLVREKSFVETIYLIIKGDLPSKEETRVLNALFTAAIDHGVGAPSTTVARVTASTKNSLHTALAAGILAMGELHGSAIEGAARFFQANLDTAQLEAKIKTMRDQKIRIPGFGHKILHHDNRTKVLLEIAKENKVYGAHCAVAESTEKILSAISSKPLPLNIDGAMAAILSDMGFDYQVMKGFFIIGRVPGLVAHIYEESMSGEGIRRLAEDEEEYVGVAERNLGN